MVSDWIERLAEALSLLAEAQAPYLRDLFWKTPRVYDSLRGTSHIKPELLLDDLCCLYGMARHCSNSGEEKYYAPLCKALDPVRYILRQHPTLSRVISPIIGRDDFYMSFPGSGGISHLTDLIAGLMSRASELAGDRYQMAAGELNAFLALSIQSTTNKLLDSLNTGYDFMLFYGLEVKEPTTVVDGLLLLPFEEIQAYIEDSLIEQLAPPSAGFHGWRHIGAVAREFRWMPGFHRMGNEKFQDMGNPHPFFREVWRFLELLAVAHATPLLRLADFAHHTNLSAQRLLGRQDQNGTCYQGRSAQAFDGFEASPKLDPKALTEAQGVFLNRTGRRYQSMAPVVGRLSEALS